MSSSRPPLALAYHGVARVNLRQDRAGLFVAPGRLVSQIRWLRRWGYELVTFGQLAASVAEGAGQGRCALTFDDGLGDNLHVLAPILADLDVPATTFVVPGLLGQPHPDAPWARMLTADEVRSLARAGVEIGSHSRHHVDLTTLTPAEVLDDLAGSRADLEALLNRPVEVAAYPYGRADAATRQACRQAGYRAACRISGDGSWDDPFDLPRQNMHNCSTDLGLRFKRDGRYEPLMAHVPARAVRSAIRRVKSVRP